MMTLFLRKLYFWLWAVLMFGSLSGCHTPTDDGIIKTHLDSPSGLMSTTLPVTLDGWVMSSEAVQNIEIRIDGQAKLLAPLDIARPDVLAAFPQYKNAHASGFKIALDREKFGLHDTHQIKIDVITARGTRHTIAETTVIADQNQRPASSAPAQQSLFYVLFATSGALNGGLQELVDIYRPLESSTIKVGIRVPILYLRTTHGRDQDWTFDSGFDTRHQCGNRTIAEDSLNSVIQTAIKLQLPVLFTLNGGIWADARCDVPEWDINDELEKDVRNCQWDQANEVHPDDFLQHLPGSENAPELARALTFNVHADKVRAYKKRNLQAAAKLIRAFQLQNPHLFVGVTLDPDVYANPFFETPRLLHDYNPDTLKQFRQWLQGTGPYGLESKQQSKNLRDLRLQPSLSLEQVNAIAAINFPTWDAVDPPRPNALEIAAIFRFPEHYKWFALWEQFRRHLVDAQYDDLSQWVTEVGIDARYISSAQGIHENPYSAVAVRVDSPLGRYDSGGASIEGAVPSHGHLGVIIYGQTTENLSGAAGQPSLFSEFRALDSGWGIVEFNTASLNKPAQLPGFGPAYRAMRDSFNYGARYVSPMAWNGSNGIYVQTPGFVSYTSVRNTPLDIAIRRLMLTHANLPRGAKLWTFGTPQHPDADGWTVNQAAPVATGGYINLTRAASSTISLESPRELLLGNGNLNLWLPSKALMPINVEAIDGRTGPTEAWAPIFWRGTNVSDGRYQLQLKSVNPIDQIRIQMKLSGAAQLDAIELRPN